MCADMGLTEPCFVCPIGNLEKIVSEAPTAHFSRFQVMSPVRSQYSETKAAPDWALGACGEAQKSMCCVHPGKLQGLTCSC